MKILIFIICFGASVAGALCGIGGGVIIKPLVDALGIMDVTTISFLSGCTVLSMSTYSVVKSKLAGTGDLKTKPGLPLAMGAALGGILGKWVFSLIQSVSENPNQVRTIQAACLLAVTTGTLLYTIYKEKITTHYIESITFCVIIGGVLGIMSSFLGIGGGPINLVVFYFFFSMSTKAAAENSLYVIFFSQLAGLIQTLVVGKVPEFALEILILMVIGGIAGGIFGRSINKRIEEHTVDKLFIVLMIVIIMINIHNIMS